MTGFHWLLAFDGSCCTCRKLSQEVDAACAGRLEVAPLQRPDVLAWRRQALGRDPRPVPTLLRVDLEGRFAPRAWTGTAMLVRLARRLGPRPGLRVLGALGAGTRPLDPRTAVVEPGLDAPATGPGRRRLGRKDFLRLVAGSGVAASILVAGRAPAAFATTTDRQVDAWIAKHAHELPTRYGEVVALPPAYRGAIHARTPVAVRRRWWAEQLARYRAHLHPGLTPAQRQVLDRAQAYLRRPDALGPAADQRELGRLGEEFRAAFDRSTAKRIVAVLQAPTDISDLAARPGGAHVDGIADCDCTNQDDWCSPVFCGPESCTRVDGCGTFWQYVCNGLCSY